MDDNLGNETSKNNDLINKEILNDMVNNDFKDENKAKDFINKLNEIHIFCGDRNLKFNEALEKLSKEVKKEIVIEIPSLKFLSNKFLLALNYLNARIVIEKFDVKDLSYSFMVSSILENKNISIKTISSVDSVNVIVDNDYALLLSEPINSGIGVGAVFTEKEEIASLKNAFDLLWKTSEGL